MTYSPVLEKPYYGNESFLKELRQKAAEGRFPHAVMLIGPAGSGKRTTASLLASMLLCKEKGIHRPGEECACCKKLAHGVHPDYIVLESENKSGTLSLKQLRDSVISTLHVYPNEADYKVYYCAAPLAYDAQNLLLKSLEEPPAHVVFLLSGESETDVLPTVQSRCVPFRLAPLSAEELSNLRPDIQGRPLFLPLSGGWPGLALALSAEQIESISKATCKLLQLCLNKQEYALLAQLEALQKDKILTAVLRCCIYLLQISMSSSPTAVFANERELAEICALLSNKLSVAKRCRLLTVLEDDLSAGNGVGRNQTLRVTALGASLCS